MRHDRVVAVQVFLELLRELVGAEAGGHGKHADAIGNERLLRRAEIGERPHTITSLMVLNSARAIPRHPAHPGA